MKWHYSGDRSIEHGGTWYNLEGWQDSYVNAVRIIDLSDYGFDGAVSIERLTINVGKGWSKDKKRAYGALELCGLKKPVGTGIGRKLCLADAYLAYGYYDPDTREEILQLEGDGPLTYDGWIARRLDGDLKTYIEETYLE